MATVAVRTRYARHRTVARATFWLLAGTDLLGALGTVVFTGGITFPEVLLIAAAGAIGLIAALAFARSVEARAAGTRTVWIARGFGLVGAAIAVLFPAILFGEMRYASPGVITPNEMVLGEIRFSVLTLPFKLVPIVVAMRMPVAGGLLFLILTAFEVVQGVYDPTGSFPERSTDLSALLMGSLPSLLVGVALIVGGVLMRREPREVVFRDFLRQVFGPEF